MTGLTTQERGDLEAERDDLAMRLADAEAERDALAAHVERQDRVIFDTLAAIEDGEPDAIPYDEARALYNDAPAISLTRRDADIASAIHLALSEGAELNNLHKAPTAGQAVDFLLSLSRQEVEKRRPMSLRASQAGTARDAQP